MIWLSNHQDKASSLEELTKQPGCRELLFHADHPILDLTSVSIDWRPLEVHPFERCLGFLDKEGVNLPCTSIQLIDVVFEQSRSGWFSEHIDDEEVSEVVTKQRNACRL